MGYKFVIKRACVSSPGGDSWAAYRRVFGSCGSDGKWLKHASNFARWLHHATGRGASFDVLVTIRQLFVVGSKHRQRPAVGRGPRPGRHRGHRQ